ncbi:ATP-binding protein [Halorubrum sp. GN12_10-3_MGM]|uniref:ATP-binding protein n=1 Tax=Halorubrum sp. GN12_10-3_MGM TaxID=2518113 RepID=UPI0010F92D2A|nr:ATP-binding protein [Halorubrum sp. GN12_10-3_MGM]TKX61860.1 ATP-binding protein [Halorubrum sp. GN12_10-3_MGM]
MINRETELEWLTSHLSRAERQLLVVYGRRRVGKTTLVTTALDALEDTSVYYLCDERGATHNARRFAAQCAAAFDDITPDVDGFVEAFQYLTARVDGPCVVALDEFSYLVDEDDTIPSVFQTVVDDVLAGTDVSLVLLGSSISMMEEGVLSYESPLYGRRTGQWKLAPLSFADVRAFFPDDDLETQIQLYSVLGGVPAYLEQFDPGLSLLENIEQSILSKGEFLYEEPEFLLRQELREPATYMAILEAIAGGATRVTEIANEIGRDASSLSRYLQNLTQLAILEQEHPVTDPDGRGLYRLTDDFLRFWFRYVAPNRGTLEQGRTAPVRSAIAETLPTHTSRTFETVCQQAVRTPGFPVSCSRVGRWWYGGEEIDIAGVNRETETLLLGECKWTTEPVGPGVFDKLTALESEVRWQGTDREVRYALFSRGGFTDELQAVVDDRSDASLYGISELATLFESQR